LFGVFIRVATSYGYNQNHAEKKVKDIPLFHLFYLKDFIIDAYNISDFKRCQRLLP